MNALFDSKYIPVSNDLAAGTGTTNCTVVDLADFDSIEVITKLGALAAGAAVLVKLQQGALANGSDMADLEGTGISITEPAASGTGVTYEQKLVVHDLARPRERYVRPVIVRSTANAEVDAVLVRLYNARQKATSQDDDYVADSEFHLSPAEGTA